MQGMGHGGGGNGSNRRRSDRKGAPDDMLTSKEKGSSTGNIDVIPEDQFHGGCQAAEVNLTSINSGNLVPSEDGSHYTKGGNIGKW